MLMGLSEFICLQCRCSSAAMENTNAPTHTQTNPFRTKMQNMYGVFVLVHHNFHVIHAARNIIKLFSIREYLFEVAEANAKSKSRCQLELCSFSVGKILRQTFQRYHSIFG